MTPSQRLSRLAVAFGLIPLAGGGVASHAAEPREVTFASTQGVTVYADLYREHDRDAPLVILFHQAGGDARGEYGPIVPRLVEAGYNVLAVDQRNGGTQFGGVNRTVAHLDDQAFDYCDAYPDLEAALAWAVAEGLGGPRAVWGSSYSAALVFQLAAKHPDDVAAVLAFSPASGEPMRGCEPEPYAKGLAAPALALRPAREMEVDSVREQLEALAGMGVKTWVADPGVHGSSMLVPRRAGGDTDATWKVVLDFLAASLGR